MKKSGRNIIKSIAFALVAVMIMGVLGAAFTPKRSDPGSGITNSNARGFYGEPKNSIFMNSARRAGISMSLSRMLSTFSLNLAG